MIRQGKLEEKTSVSKAMAEVKDPLEIHRAHLPALPSFNQAQQSANKGELYCFWCASYHLVKNGQKNKNDPNSSSFKCRDCKSAFSYKMPKGIYDAFNGFAKMKKGKYKPRKK